MDEHTDGLDAMSEILEYERGGWHAFLTADQQSELHTWATRGFRAMAHIASHITPHTTHVAFWDTNNHIIAESNSHEYPADSHVSEMFAQAIRRLKRELGEG